jgi:protein ImuB
VARRILALWLPRLPTDRLRRLEPALRGVPLATWSSCGNRRLLFAADGPALLAGQALADAQAICPGLVLRPADPQAEAALLERLALWCLRWTPLAAVDSSDGLLLDVTGCAELFGSEAALLEQACAGLRRAGFAVRAALAGTAEAAAALARVADRLIVPPGEDLAAVRPLPLAALRLPAEVVNGLSRLGLQTMGDRCQSRWSIMLLIPIHQIKRRSIDPSAYSTTTLIRLQLKRCQTTGHPPNCVGR